MITFKIPSDMNKTLFIAMLAALPVFAQQEIPKSKDIPVPAPGMEQPRHWGAAGEMPGRKGREDFHKQMLEKYDVDKDGQLSETEKEAMKADMEKRRAEGNNRPGVRGDRKPNGPRGKRPEGKQRQGREDFHKQMLEKYDVDKDGQLSETEKEAMKADMEKRRAEGNNRPGVRGDRAPKGPRGGKRGEAPQGAAVPAMLPL